VTLLPYTALLGSPELAARGLDAVERGIVVRVVGVRYRMIRALFKLLPDALALKLIAAYSGNFRVTERGGKPSA
jgi:hypothetical protein